MSMQTNAAIRDRAVGALMGLAIGDAVGTTLEFKQRDTYQPLTGLVGGGPFDLEAGQWTDDTAMALCLADSLLAHRELNTKDLMSRFTNWWRYGYNSCTGSCFDIGNTVSAALTRFEEYGVSIAGSIETTSAGNGSLMRLSPVSIRWHQDPPKLRAAAGEQSRTTHAATACIDACRLFADMTAGAINGTLKSELLRPQKGDYVEEINQIAMGSYLMKSRDQVRGSGYVVESLEAALWAVFNADSFRDAILLAANLGDDADTTAAITGQLAGALWGKSGMPADWINQLAWNEKIELTAIALYERGLQADTSK